MSRDAPEARPRLALGSTDGDHITQWQRNFAFVPGKRSGRDWNFLSMQAPEGDQTSFVSLPGNAQRELYEYPGLFLDSTGAEQMMKNRIQASETNYETVDAASTLRDLGPGMRITPTDKAVETHEIAQQVITAIRHVAVDPTYETRFGNASASPTCRMISTIDSTRRRTPTSCYLAS